MTLISDHDKGLLAADTVLGVGVDRLICCFYLKCNFVKRYQGVEQFFWPIANATTIEEYSLHMHELQQVNNSAAEYLAAIDLTLWVTAYLPPGHQNFGHKTSNVVESMNSVLKDEWELSILDLLNEIWHFTMDQRFKRFSTACDLLEKHQIFTDFCLKQLLRSKCASRKNTLAVHMSSAVKGSVTQGNDRVYIVDVDACICDCGWFQENGIPCSHAFSCIYRLQNQSPRDYVPDLFTIQTWKNTYLLNFEPVTLNVCDPPTKLQAAAEWPQKMQLTIESCQKQVAWAHAVLNNEIPPPERGPGSLWCRICGEYGHNQKACSQKYRIVSEGS